MRFGLGKILEYLGRMSCLLADKEKRESENGLHCRSGDASASTAPGAAGPPPR